MMGVKTLLLGLIVGLIIGMTWQATATFEEGTDDVGEWVKFDYILPNEVITHLYEQEWIINILVNQEPSTQVWYTGSQKQAIQYLDKIKLKYDFNHAKDLEIPGYPEPLCLPEYYTNTDGDWIKKGKVGLYMLNGKFHLIIGDPKC